MRANFEVPFGLDLEVSKRNLEICVLWQLARLRDIYPLMQETSVSSDYLDLPLGILVQICWENEEALRKVSPSVVS